MIAALDFCPTHGLFDQPANGFGSDAIRVQSELDEISANFNASVFFSGNAQVAIADLHALAEKAQHDGWDGEDGIKISQPSKELAEKLLWSMPRDWAAPDVDLDSDGAVALQWYGGLGLRLSVSIGPNGKLAYAWIQPGITGQIERNYGVATSNGFFPATIYEVVSRLGAQR